MARGTRRLAVNLESTGSSHPPGSRWLGGEPPSGRFSDPCALPSLGSARHAEPGAGLARGAVIVELEMGQFASTALWCEVMVAPWPCLVRCLGPHRRAPCPFSLKQQPSARADPGHRGQVTPCRDSCFEVLLSLVGRSLAWCSASRSVQPPAPGAPRLGSLAQRQQMDLPGAGGCCPVQEEGAQ